MIRCGAAPSGGARKKGQAMEFTFDFSVWFAILLVSLIVVCGAVVALVFRRITTRYENKIEQLQNRG